MASVLVVGDSAHLTGLIQALDAAPEAGYRVVAVCCADAEHTYIGRVPVLGDETEAAEIAKRMGVDTVTCTSSATFGRAGLRRLGWAREGQDIDLVVSPGLTHVARSRVLTRPVERDQRQGPEATTGNGQHVSPPRALAGPHTTQSDS